MQRPEYCVDCTDRGSDRCSLPTGTESLITIGKKAGAYVLESIAGSSGAIITGMAFPPEGGYGLVAAVRTEAERVNGRVQACIADHRQEDAVVADMCLEWMLYNDLPPGAE